MTAAVDKRPLCPVFTKAERGRDKRKYVLNNQSDLVISTSSRRVSSEEKSGEEKSRLIFERGSGVAEVRSL